MIRALIWVLGLVGLAGPLERWAARREARRMFEDMMLAATVAREELIEKGEIHADLLKWMAEGIRDLRRAEMEGKLEEPNLDELLTYTSQLIGKHYDFGSTGWVDPTIH